MFEGLSQPMHLLEFGNCARPFVRKRTKLSLPRFGKSRYSYFARDSLTTTDLD